jgi:hypothetical protein
MKTPIKGYIQGEVQFSNPVRRQPIQQSSALDLIKNMTQTSADRFRLLKSKEFDTVGQWIERYADIYQMWATGYTCPEIKKVKEDNGQKVSNNTIYNVRRLALNVKAYYAAGYSYEEIMNMEAAQLYVETPQSN